MYYTQNYLIFVISQVNGAYVFYNTSTKNFKYFNIQVPILIPKYKGILFPLNLVELDYIIDIGLNFSEVPSNQCK